MASVAATIAIVLLLLCLKQCVNDIIRQFFSKSQEPAALLSAHDFKLYLRPNVYSLTLPQALDMPVSLPLITINKRLAGECSGQALVAPHRSQKGYSSGLVPTKHNDFQFIHMLSTKISSYAHSTSRYAHFD